MTLIFTDSNGRHHVLDTSRLEITGVEKASCKGTEGKWIFDEGIMLEAGETYSARSSEEC